MAAPQFEQADNVGQTIHRNGTVGTTAIALPATAGKGIAEFWIMNPSTNPRTAVLSLSLDGGATFRSLPWNSDFSWGMKGIVPQIFIKASQAAVAYESILNIEID